MPVPRSSAIIRISELMAELGVDAQRLVMPTRDNLEALDKVLQAGATLVDMKRHVDRVEQELRTLSAQREGFVPPLHSRGVCPATTDCVDRD
jgi:DNA methyltransferase 1-associated protein 1